ncbi:MAG: M48 family metallopeptidase [Janthinobacterium lividum]
MNRLFRIFFLLLLVLGARQGAGAPPAAAALAAAPAAPAAPPVLVVPAGAQAGPHFNVETATQAYLDTLTPAQKAKSDAYFEGGYWLLLWGLLVDVAVAAVFLPLGLSRRMQGWVGGIRRVNLRTLAYGALYLLLAAALAFPWAVYVDFVREHQYDLSNQTFGAWLAEQLTGLALTVAAGAPLIMLLYVAIRRTGRRWWAWGAAGTVVFLAIGSFLGPVLISPLFNQYTPLPPSPVRARLLSLARANDVPATNIYLVDASRQSKRVSANVSGIGSTIRISLNDNLLNRCSPEEVEGVMGHEMGHYVLNHGWKSLLEMGLVILAGFAAADWAFRRLVARHGPAWGIGGLADVGGLPLLSVLFSFFIGFLAKPVFNTIIRTAEIEADQFGYNAARQPDGEATVDMKLSEYRKISPGPLEEFLFFDHPSGHTRVRMAMQWKAEHLSDKQPAGQP